MSSQSLSGRHVLVLGGASGIGLATARAAAGAGATVTVGSRDPERGLSQLPAGSQGIAVDLADEAAVAGVFDRTGPIDHLVYTAGEPLALMPLAELDPARARSAFTLRYFGALTAARAAVPHLRDGGSITLTTGVAGERPGAGWSVAASICGAVSSLTRALAVELAPRLRVNAVSPGVVRSPLWSSMSEADRDLMYRQTAASIPLGRVGGVEDIAAAYLFCLTATFTTGIVLTTDGGSVLA